MKLEIVSAANEYGVSIKIDGKEYNYCITDLEIKAKPDPHNHILPYVTITFMPTQLSIDNGEYYDNWRNPKDIS